MPLNDHFRQLWTDAGYHTKMGSAAVLPPPRREFRRLYHMTTAEYAISNIVFRRLKVGRFSQMNDPFELWASREANRPKRANERETRERIEESLGVLCFSEDWTDPVLWSHYAARHRGVCLGFDVSRERVKQVIYTSTRTTDDGTNRQAMIDIMLRTKFESWKYEQEWRVLVNLKQAITEGNLYFVPFSDTLRLAEIILGPLCSLKISDVRSVVEKHSPDVLAFCSRLAFKSFNVVPKESTVPAASKVEE